ncbi:hypothetical protein COCMIDRAFT_107097 [Bipolaris oryzae ATCC 44560]|uniref:Uncharacterized protein n=1 Tax=Bipolaris oryzae ATCC 44560 TaxID=930090 RepID=W6YU96_COCMI|nr:uncharacterized protein COCMIDRAFT_107097 [Bipolaris oryzae ATCC 44560]EUC41103.1 hypothetical protein COCMIDRAFT_107097 [Bipolaris oryzae ATCC 44560]
MSSRQIICPRRGTLASKHSIVTYSSPETSIIPCAASMYILRWPMGVYFSYKMIMAAHEPPDMLLKITLHQEKLM